MHSKPTHGFTLIEVLVVLTIIATLLSLVSPRYFEAVERSKEVSLRHDLSVMRDAIDKYYSDRGIYPSSLEEMVERKYLRAVPEDPITQSIESWITSPPADPYLHGDVYDVHSGSPDIAQDGSNYADW
ncbi:type II secretion system protein G [Methylovorus sp. MM2]|uniref:type II secretion system protein n=1 Tax=Methylovorus sp. MM2 TaxID=1848038 RepID=UPI0007E01CC5|nr:prepilin-type N-terminal cleavage/methylation domain-containing protein [Methylovorus sp. MM2]OAM51333.1 type II secretion system protein G [Methylovorus sp. MM2]